MKILSIDYDYFFPDSMPYDWGANEERALYYEIIWHTRCSSHNIMTKESALEAYVPTIRYDFWDRIVTNQPRVTLVADSHFAIFDFLDNADVTHLDAHHDCGYRDVKDDFNSDQAHIDCGNWARWGKMMDKIKKNRLFYPEWRKKSEEGGLVDWLVDEVNYGLPLPQEYDCIFICRSSCWTPPWFDRKFRSFVTNSPSLSIQYLDSIVQKIRKPTMKQAIELKKQQEKLLGKVTETIYADNQPFGKKGSHSFVLSSKVLEEA